ncbi:hypothetical protein [Cylindrospermum sp. FACHB-282]|uniref:hypothetical protein n=1 Tax=Cylindrospermum sp. FACHB-282 TaxID=2692794 RepID=UPI0016862197|nr:hypothetical protein [Cylindrospermum sp. FACHB-282]MBD2388812.1 hypothetical protein [Cylindrospermum sp. FACHB-282]
MTKTTLWTEQHDEFCLENKITPSAKLLWQYLIREGGEGQEAEPDLKEFNEWVEKHRGKGFSRPTLKKALQQLTDSRVVQTIKQFTWRLVRIVTRPLDWLSPKKKLPKRDKTFKYPTPNDLSLEQGDSSSSNTLITDQEIAECEAVLSECENAGIVFDPLKSPEILEYGLEDVKRGIALFKARGGHETDYRGRPKIKNPQGWLLQCLRKGWHEPEPTGWLFFNLLRAMGVELP